MLRNILLSVTTLLVCMADGAHATPPKPLQVLVDSASQSTMGASVPVSVTVEFATAIDTLDVDATSSGSLDTTFHGVRLYGPWQSGDRVAVQLDAVASGSSDGTIDIVAVGYGDDGAERASAAATLYAVGSGQSVWLSPSSATDARIRRAVATHARSPATHGIQETRADPLAAAIDEIVTTRVAADDTRYDDRPLTGHEKQIRQAFEPAAGTQQLDTEVVTNAAVTISVTGRAQWTDSAGGLHPIPMAAVEIRDDDVLSSRLIASVTTDAKGDYAATFTHDDGAGAGDPDIFVRVLARSAVSDVKPDSILGTTYRLDSPVQREVPDGANLTINLIAGNVDDSETAFSIHHALVVIGAYAGGLAGVSPSHIDTRFPTTKRTSLFDGTNLHILQKDRWDWDVIHHEFGHYFMAIHGFQANPGGSHGFADNLTQTRGSKSIGVRLAWGEGWPTFFGIVGQQATGAASLNVPNVGDIVYSDTEDASINENLETSTGKGEDNEVSVFAVLWDLYDNAADGADQLSLGDRALFDAFKSASAKTVGEAWQALADVRDARGKTVLGGVFAQSKIAPGLTAPADNTELVAGAAAPTFKWMKNGGGTPTPLNDFTIKFYTSDLRTVIFQKSLGDTDSFTPTTAELTTILGGGAVVKWVVEGRNTVTPATPDSGQFDRYWSESRSIGGAGIAFVIDDTGSMIEEINGVKSALQAFIDSVASTLPPGDTPPTIQLITFKDFVQERLMTNDLNAMRAAVGSLFASGGADCPEFSAQALQVAGKNVGPGGTILLATDASSRPGVDIGTVIADLTAKGVTVNTILSGDCTGIGSSGVTALAAEADASDRSFAAAGDALVESGFQHDDGSEADEKPGDEDPPQDPIPDPGQAPIDAHGDTPETATLLPLDGIPVRGRVDTIDDVDYFRLELEQGEAYPIDHQLDKGAGVDFVMTNASGAFQYTTFAFSTASPTRVVFNPPATGSYYLRAFGRFNAPRAYRVSVSQDPFAELTSAVSLFSTISAQTGGVFIVRDDVNTGSDAAYVNAVLNVLKSTVEPTALSANPDKLPQGTRLAVTLSGRNTNWRDGATVSFGGSGLDVVSVDVTSATSLAALVDVDAGATTGFRDVTVETDLGSDTETATGFGVVEVTGPVLVPSVLSVEPSVVNRGDQFVATIRGVNTQWSTTSTVSLGTGISIDSVDVVDNTRIEVQATVADNTIIGFRTASVDTPGIGRQSKARSLFVNSAIVALPQIVSVTPAEGSQGQTLDLLVTGVNTAFQAGLTSATFGSGIDVQNVDVIDASNANVQISIAPDAAAGFRNVNLVTGTETAVLLNGFFVYIATTTLRGDIDADGDVDRDDVMLILAARGQPATAGDARDLDQDGTISMLDARLAVLACTRPACATGP